jgi:GT2 family glycosyltransferase
MFLRASLASLCNASIHDYEVVVVDDASTDASVEIAGELATRVIRVPNRGGPAKARNLGAIAARGEFLVFFDADVRVHPATVDRLVNVLLEEASVAAVFGSYDDQPACAGLVSQFRNLLHHDIHQSSHQEAASFWAGCGAIRRDSFLRLGGFDESYRRPNIEDIDLGRRLHAAGERILLIKDALVTHLKPWTLSSMIRCDFASRGIPWTRLLLQQRFLPNDLNLKYVHRASVGGVLLFVAALLAAGSSAMWLWLAMAMVVGILLSADAWTARGGTPGLFAAALTSLCGIAGFRAAHVGGATQFGLVLLAATIAVNLPFYGRLRRVRGAAFAILAIPLHLVHYGVCGAAFLAGCGLHAREVLFGRQPRRVSERSRPRISEYGSRETALQPAAVELEEHVT